MNEVEVFHPDTEVSMNLRKCEALHHIACELEGVINEFRAMPCDSLERRMFSTVDRYKQRLRDCSPIVDLQQWNNRLLEEHNRHLANEARLKEYEDKHQK